MGLPSYTSSIIDWSMGGSTWVYAVLEAEWDVYIYIYIYICMGHINKVDLDPALKTSCSNRQSNENVK